MTYEPDGQSVWLRFTLRDFDGRLIRKVNETSSQTLVADEDFIFRGDQPLGKEIFDVSPTPFHLSLDHLGSVRTTTNGDGTIVAKKKFYPFGEEATPFFEQAAVALKYTGHERDAYDPTSNGDDRDYMHARFSSPVTGRFLSVDPVLTGRALKNPQAWNRYGYAIGNPLKFVDPDGKEAMLFIVAPSRADTNPKGVVGHSAMYVTSPSGTAGVSTYGDFDFRNGIGAFVRGYTGQGREVRMFVLKTTDAQDSRMVDFIAKNPNGGIDPSGSIMKENCTGACVNVLQAGGVVGQGEDPASYWLLASTPSSLQQSLETGDLSGYVGAVVTFPPDPPKQPGKEPKATCPDGQRSDDSGGCP